MPTLSIRFTPADVARIRVATRPDPMWEVISSLHRLQTRRGYADFGPWHRQVRRDICRTGLDPLIRTVLLPLAPLHSYWPDFLTPTTGVDDPEEAFQAVLDTPRGRLARELELLTRTGRPLPAWTCDLARGRAPALRELGRALRSYHEVAIAPYWSTVADAAGHDRMSRGTTMITQGVEAVLDRLSPYIAWRPPVLEVSGYPVDRELTLNGRGLTLVPSYFCWRNPVALADPDLPPVLVYPAQGVPQPAEATTGPGVGVLLGQTRLAVLAAATCGATTTELARRAGVSVGTASHHATVLRGAGLISSRRDANMMLHMVTPLGRALLRQGRPAGHVEASAPSA